MFRVVLVATLGLNLRCCVYVVLFFGFAFCVLLGLLAVGCCWLLFAGWIVVVHVVWVVCGMCCVFFVVWAYAYVWLRFGDLRFGVDCLFLLLSLYLWLIGFACMLCLCLGISLFIWVVLFIWLVQLLVAWWVYLYLIGLMLFLISFVCLFGFVLILCLTG